LRLSLLRTNPCPLLLLLQAPCDAAQRAELLADSQAWVGQQLPAFMARLAECGWQPERAYLPAPTYTAGW
jgi:hypothetical protein